MGQQSEDRSSQLDIIPAGDIDHAASLGIGREHH